MLSLADESAGRILNSRVGARRISKLTSKQRLTPKHGYAAGTHTERRENMIPKSVLEPGIVASASVLQREPVIGLAGVLRRHMHSDAGVCSCACPQSTIADMAALQQMLVLS